MKPTVYIETSIPSFYCERRAEPEMVARREWTRHWWDNFASECRLVTSAAVIDEIRAGDFPNRSEALELALRLERVPGSAAVAEIVDAYIRHKLMPANPVGDALHLALASYHKCDFLLTWNCRHLANANKFGHIRRINAMLGLFIAALVTPLELAGGRE